VAQENPQMLFAEFQWGVFGESPVIFFALLLGK
jgi:hypothetical protein